MCSLQGVKKRGSDVLAAAPVSSLVAARGRPLFFCEESAETVL